MNRKSCRRPRGGFTLVELLVVIIIIGILIALLVPVIAGAVRTARDAAVTTEVNNLSQALADFKSKFGDYPPSRILLMENGAFDTTATAALGSITWLGTSQPALVSPNGDITYGQLAQRSLRFLRKFFPRAQFSSTSAAVFATPYPNGWYDFNGNANTTTAPDASPILLEGHECLAFFLGGIPTTSTSTSGPVISMAGFGKNPTNPFLNATVAPNRSTPYYEFRSSRLIDDDGDGIPGYVDSIASQDEARYLTYFSSYGGGSYDPNDVNFQETNDSVTPAGAASRVFNVNFPVTGSTTRQAISFGPNPYTSGLPAVPVTTGTTPPPTIWVNPESFQIISAGRDRLYGVGGQYLPESTAGRLPIDDLAAAYHAAANRLSADIRQREQDNLTNFAPSRLD